MENIFSKDLPTGYSFIFNDDISSEEIIALRESVGWHGDSAKRWNEVIQQSLFTVGVRSPGGKLAGMACLAGNVRHAVMCDLCVTPEHQRGGIGEALMRQLYDAVYELGIAYVYAELAKTNPFKERMLRSGFEETGDSLFWEAQNHSPEPATHD